MHCAADQATEWGHFHNCVISLRAVVLLQHLDYKTLDQRGAKRRDSGTLTCQMAVPLPLLSCRRAATGGSLEAGTYAIQHAWSAVQLVALKHPSEAKHGQGRDSVQSHLLRIVYLHVRAATVVTFQTCRRSLNIERGEREISPPSRYRSVQEHTADLARVFHKSFKLLSSHTNIPLTKKVCRLTETQEILKENIFFELFIYSLPPPKPLAHTILAVFICLIGADIQDSSDVWLFFFLFAVRGERQGQGLASHSNIHRSQTNLSRTTIYNNRYMKILSNWGLNRSTLHGDVCRKSRIKANRKCGVH